MLLRKFANTLLTGFIILTGLLACTRNRIEFGSVPENNYSYLAYIDTVGIRLSSVLIDSYATGGASSFLLGRYNDPYLGVIKASPFFQLDKPAVVPDFPATAIYDSLTFIMKLTDYYYGDTSRIQTIAVHELSQPITTGYADKLYNNSNVSVHTLPLGVRTLSIRPTADDSVIIRLNDGKGLEVFNKLKQLSADITSTENFLNYFKGLSLVTATSDTTAVYGISAAGCIMRVHYHTNTPYEELHHIDFPILQNHLAFNQVLADRSGTGITSRPGGVTEIPSSQTRDYSFTQPGTGLALKMIFPSLKDILLTKDYVKLLKAELIIRPANLSFDRHKYKLPVKLELAVTDGSNINNGLLSDSTGQKTLFANPVIDAIYGANTYYRFNITSYINQLLQSPGNDKGLYVLPEFSETGPVLDRLVMSAVSHTSYTSQLQLSVLIVNK
jgi:hypothetical protein